MNRETHQQDLIDRKLPEMVALERLIESLGDRARVNVEAVVSHEGVDFPIYSLVIGSEDATAPCLGVFGGVHGLERIGSQVVIAWIQTLNELMDWDDSLRARLQKSRLVFMPIVNPVGIYLTRRSNGNGVDLMRNAPVVADERPVFLLGGQTYSNLLPWYRGNTATPEGMEQESKALCDLVRREIFPSRTSLTVDVHSGFGAVDRLWFPYARTRKPPPHLIEIAALKGLFDRSYPNHFYCIEPQAMQYTTHGDLWDWLYDGKVGEKSEGVFLPWTLELGSWLWLKKNPRQFFSSLGAFNPMMPHRLQRILRRHLTLFDFLHRAVISPEGWTGIGEDGRKQLHSRAMELWYDDIE
jgi:hypothetical protein